ncbi:hypothetical protein [Streptomyces canus]|uniref:hypothetical protein n=1 Tax=Streptomyces canus TaxID=58343 RepID=UPI00386DB460|nr:hypothetical protein OH824_17665 [Streptomyces canus]
MTPRAARIAAALRLVQPVRPLLAYELRGSVVQLFGPGTTDPTWTATPELLAEAIDEDLTQAEEKDIPAGSITAGGPGTAFTPHALVLARDEHDFVGTCACGRAIGRSPQGRSTDGLVGLWEQHADQADRDAIWADALSATATGPS